ncbi:MAG: SCP2 sterol-binding domain-containing protein [Candidatus Helarchaeota archaeon]
MEDIKAFVKKAETMSKEELIQAFPEIIEKAKAVGFTKVTKEIPDISDLIRNKLAEFEVDDAIALMRKFLPVLFEAMKEVIESNEDLQEELEDIEDTKISMVVEDADFAMTFIVEEGKLNVQMEQAADADLTLKLTKEAMKAIMAGQSDPIQAYMAGDVKTEGEIAKAMALRSLFEMLGEEFGFELM